MSKQIDLMQNTDSRVRRNIYYVIEIGCILNRSTKENYNYVPSSSNVSLLVFG